MQTTVAIFLTKKLQLFPEVKKINAIDSRLDLNAASRLSGRLGRPARRPRDLYWTREGTVLAQC